MNECLCDFESRFLDNSVALDLTGTDVMFLMMWRMCGIEVLPQIAVLLQQYQFLVVMLKL